MQRTNSAFGQNTRWGKETFDNDPCMKEALSRMRRDLKRMEVSRQKHQQPIVRKDNYCSFEKLDIPSTPNLAFRKQPQYKPRVQAKQRQTTPQTKLLRTFKPEEHNAHKSPITDRNGLPKSISFSGLCIPDAAKDPPRRIHMASDSVPRNDQRQGTPGSSSWRRGLPPKRKACVPVFRSEKTDQERSRSRNTSVESDGGSDGNRPETQNAEKVDRLDIRIKPMRRAAVPKQSRRPTSKQSNPESRLERIKSTPNNQVGSRERSRPPRLIQSASAASRRLRSAQAAAAPPVFMETGSPSQFSFGTRPKTSPDRISVAQGKRILDPASCPPKTADLPTGREARGSRRMGQCPYCMMVFLGEHTECSANFGRG